MLIEVPEKVAKKIVVKRDGKKVEFDGAKIALAIQKGFGDIVKGLYVFGGVIVKPKEIYAIREAI